MDGWCSSARLRANIDENSAANRRSGSDCSEPSAYGVRKRELLICRRFYGTGFSLIQLVIAPHKNALRIGFYRHVDSGCFDLTTNPLIRLFYRTDSARYPNLILKSLPEFICFPFGSGIHSTKYKILFVEKAVNGNIIGSA